MKLIGETVVQQGLKDRDHIILQAVINSYIGSGEPVGSRSLSRVIDLQLSPATIRNIMSDLEDMGYLRQPHVSAGRIPTDKAYRFLVNCIVENNPATAPLPHLEEAYRSLKGEPKNLIRGTSKVLSDISHYVGLVMAPRFINTILRHIEFVRLGRRKVLAILVSDEGLVQNRVIEAAKDYTQAQLDRIGNLLNSKYSRKPLRQVRNQLLQEMADDKSLYDSLLKEAICSAQERDETAVGPDEVYVDGTSNILSMPELANLDTMKRLFRAFERKSRLVDLLDRCIDAEGVKIFIGAENPYHELQDLSLVTAPYRKEGSVLGVIGVLGPTRMEYGKIIPMVDYAAHLLTEILSGRP